MLSMWMVTILPTQHLAQPSISFTNNSALFLKTEVMQLPLVSSDQKRDDIDHDIVAMVAFALVSLEPSMEEFDSYFVNHLTFDPHGFCVDYQAGSMAPIGLHSSNVTIHPLLCSSVSKQTMLLTQVADASNRLCLNVNVSITMLVQLVCITS